MDRIDRAILEQLRRCRRQSNTEIADLVGLTPSPDPAAGGRDHPGLSRPRRSGHGSEVHVDFELKDQAKVPIREFEAALIAFDEVIEARRTFGAPDCQALVAVADLHLPGSTRGRAGDRAGSAPRWSASRKADRQCGSRARGRRCGCRA